MSVAASDLIQRFSLEQSSGPRAAPDLSRLYEQVRSCTEELCAPLETEDYVIQSMPDCSPTKWHLAHTSWFFETFGIRPGLPGYRSLDERSQSFWNSYYVAAGGRVLTLSFSTGACVSGWGGRVYSTATAVVADLHLGYDGGGAGQVDGHALRGEQPVIQNAHHSPAPPIRAACSNVLNRPR